MDHDSEPKEATPADPENGPVKLPTPAAYPVVAGAALGVLLRLVFAGPGGSPWSAMSGAFIFGAPFAVGMLTVYLAERAYRRSWRYYIVASMLAATLFVVGTVLVLIEGLLCAVFVIPLFALVGALGGLTMGVVCRLTRWPTPTLCGAVALPLLLAGFGSAIPTPTRLGVYERSIRIEAPAEVVWRTLNDIDGIESAEMSSAWLARLGAPTPLSGTTRPVDGGLVRTSRWGKMVHFDEVIVDWQPPHFVRWRYRFGPDSFPPHALDDHVVLGGHYVDLIDTAYALTAEGTATRLTTRVRYRVTTQFNFYADALAQGLLGNLSEAGLRLYKDRSERELAVPPAGDAVARR